MSEAPETYRRFRGGYPDLAAAYESLSRLTMEAGPLSERERRLVKLGVAMGARSQGATRSAIRKAADAGLGVEELRHATFLGLVTVGLPDTLLTLKWVDELTTGDRAGPPRPGRV